MVPDDVKLILSGFLDPFYILKCVVVVILANFAVKTLTTFITERMTTDITKIPEPYTPLYRRFTIGHNVLGHIMIDPFNARHLYNNWRREMGEIYQLRSLLGERIIIIASERGMREVNVTKSSCFSKDAGTRASISSLVGTSGILLAEGDDHKRLRKAVSPALHHETLISLGDIFLEQGKRLSHMLGERGHVDDILDVVRVRTFNVIFETCFGEKVAPTETVDKLREAYTAIFLEPPLRALMRIMAQKLLWFIDLRYLQYRNDLRQYVQKTIYDLCEQNSGRSDRMSLLNLMSSSSNEKALAYQEMVNTVLSFLLAGQITTSLSVSWTLYLLASHPEWQDRLIHELENWSENDGLGSLDKLPLLSRIVRESLRLYPPVFSIGRIATQPVVIDGYQLPKGTSVRMPMLALQRSPDIWGADANEFNPDRFLKDGELARTKMYWCLFLFGPRGCIGQRFALLEIKAFVAQIIVRQRVYIKPMQDPVPTVHAPLCTPKDMNLYFEERRVSSKEG